MNGIVALALVGRVAVAQDGFDAHGFQLAPLDADLRDLLSVERPGRTWGGEAFLGAALEYAASPLSYQVLEGGEPTGVVNRLDDVVALNTTAGFAPRDGLRLSLGAPLYLVYRGRGERLRGPALGDIHLSAQVHLLSPRDADAGGAGLAFVPFVDIPTGPASAWLGDRSFSGGGLVSGTWEAARLTFTGNAGVRFNPAIEAWNVTGADVLVLGLGAGWRVDASNAVSIEGTWDPALSRSKETVGEPGTTSPAQAILSGRHRWDSGQHTLVGVGAGLNDGVGAAAWRLFVGGGFGRVGNNAQDRDLDGIFNRNDVCPDEAETRNNYRDDDGCPDALADVTVHVRFKGNPYVGAKVTLEGGAPTSYESGAEPQIFTTTPDATWTARAESGCLQGETSLLLAQGVNRMNVALDLVRTGTLNFAVREAGTGRPLPDVQVRVLSSQADCQPPNLVLGPDGTGSEVVGIGHHVVVVAAQDRALSRTEVDLAQGENLKLSIELQPAKTRLEERSIVILDKVFFAFNASTILPASFPLLDEVANLILANPKVTLVEVAGHTDEKGRADYNVSLSQARAEAVKTYLVGKGVDPARLDARGYGSVHPVASNSTAAGRDANRRVEFTIQKIADKAPTGGEK